MVKVKQKIVAFRAIGYADYPTSEPRIQIETSEGYIDFSLKKALKARKSLDKAIKQAKDDQLETLKDKEGN